MTGRDTGNGLTPSSHHVLVTSVDKHLVVNVDMGHPHLSWGQDVRSSCLTESLEKISFKHGQAESQLSPSKNKDQIRLSGYSDLV